MVIVIKDFTCFLTHLQRLLHQRIVALRTVSTVTIEVACDVIHPVSLSVNGCLTYGLIDGVYALKDILLRMLIDTVIFTLLLLLPTACRKDEQYSQH